MAKYIYPAVFRPETNGSYSVIFPDIDGCFTCGDDLEDALFMAKDALSLVLMNLEDQKETIPEPSNINNLNTSGNSFLSLVQCNTSQYRKFLRNKAVRKKLDFLNKK